MTETRYAFVARNLAGGIASGEYPVGSTLPNEIALAAQFGVSRQTVRAALSELQQLGLVSRRRNAGTRVESSEPVRAHSTSGQSLATIEDLTQYAAETERVVLGMADVVMERGLARHLGLQPGQEMLRIQHLRVHPDRVRKPICWTDMYVDFAFRELRDVIPEHRGLFANLIETRFGRRIAEVSQSIRAVGVPEGCAEALAAAAGSHALEIVRRYHDAAGSPLLVTCSIHPADRFSYEIKLSRGLGGR